MNKKKTLRRQFVLRMFIIMISITLISGLVQFYVINNQVNSNVNREASMIAQSIEQGINETQSASLAIEKQIDYKLEILTKTINEKLPENVDSITNDQLVNLTKEMNIAGIDLFAYDENDIISVVKSSEEDEIGFTLKGISEEGYAEIEKIMNDKASEYMGPASYQNENTIILFTAQAGSREETPLFFKYAYHKDPNSNFIISTFIEANEVYQFTQEVGPETWINKVLNQHEYTKQIAVLDPRVFADPSLAESMYPPLKKVVYGEYTSIGDDEIIINMIENPEKTTRIVDKNGEKVYEMFIPYQNGNVIYVAMDYEKMSAPFRTFSLILIAFGFISLIILFVTTTRFFNKIYNNITKIISQIKSHEKGDFTVRSDVNDKGELGQLSQSTNKMADTLNEVLGQTREQAIKTERHAYLLESEANSSVDKVYTLSMEHTSQSRESIDDALYYLDQLESFLQPIDTPEAKELLERTHGMRHQIKIHSNDTTEMTITLSDLLKSLHSQSSSLSEIAKSLLKNLEQFDLYNDGKSDRE